MLLFGLSLVWEPHMRGFIEELRHRNVFRVGIAYVIAGWLIAQAADLAGDAFNAPDWFMQMLIILLLIGMPIALFLAWAYELTPDGVVKAAEVPVDAPKDPRSGRLLNRATIIALIIAVAWLGWDKLQQPSITPESAATAVDRSIAVLPFVDFSPDGDHAWFAEGLTEEILNSLARTPDLQIASRTSSFAFRGTTDDIPAIAAQLGVAHILEGSVRRAGDRLRVTAQLIRATDDTHLWSKNFDGSSDDSISIQEEIAFDIANALQTAMDPEELARMLSAGTRSVEAWEIYLRGLAINQHMYETWSATDAAEAIALFDRAVELDPGFADAHLMLAELWETQINPTSTSFSAEGLPLAERRVHYVAAIRAASKYARSEMSRLDAEMRAADFELRIADQIETAIKMTELAPERGLGWGWLTFLYNIVGEFDKARETGLLAWDLPVEAGGNRAFLMQTMHRTSIEDAMPMVDELLEVPNPQPNTVYQSHRALLAAGQTERAAGLAEDFLRRSQDEEGRLLVQVRQACAENRVADADALFATVDQGSNARWIFLKTLGRDDDARDTLKPLDTPDTVFILAEYLVYRSFEARDFPLLWKALTAQGINRPPARPMAYQCRR